MRPSLSLSLAAAAGATAAALAASPAAYAADAVYGGSSRGGDPIVLKADAKAKQLRSAVISWRAVCGDGDWYPGAGTLTPVKPVAGFSPNSSELLVSQNGKGRFKGVQLGGFVSGSSTAAIQVELEGTLKPSKATGKLSATVKIADRASGAAVASCTATLSWTAARVPGIVYGGSTSQGEPFVVRLDARRKTVNDVLTTWRAPCTPSGGYFRVPDHFGNFSVKSSGVFGGPFGNDFPMDAGGKRHYGYDLGGRITKTGAKGTLQVRVAETDPAGASTDNCDTGAVTWKAATG